MEKYDTQGGAGNIQSAKDSEESETNQRTESSKSCTGSGRQVSVQALEIAMQQCEVFLRSKAHEDIDSDVDVSVEMKALSYLA